MAIQNPVRAIEGLTGEFHAIYMFLQALAKTHPHPAILMMAFEEASQRGQAVLEQAPIDDPALRAYEDTVAGLLTAIRANPRSI